MVCLGAFFCQRWVWAVRGVVWGTVDLTSTTRGPDWTKSLACNIYGRRTNRTSEPRPLEWALRGHFRGHLRGTFRGSFHGESLKGRKQGKSTLVGALVSTLVVALVGGTHGCSWGRILLPPAVCILTYKICRCGAHWVQNGNFQGEFSLYKIAGYLTQPSKTLKSIERQSKHCKCEARIRSFTIFFLFQAGGPKSISRWHANF